jgi:AcrR family transcriptional regulator
MQNHKDLPDGREKIIEAARRLFVEKGMKKTTVRQIAAQAGMNVAMVNYYFGSKENLCSAVYGEALQLISERIFQLIDSEMPLFQLLEEWINYYYDTLLQYPDVPLFVLSEMAQRPVSVVDKFMKKSPYMLFARLAILLNDEQRNGNIRQVSLPDFLLNALGMLVFPFLARPFISKVLNMSEIQYMDMVSEHRQHVFDYICRALRNEEEASQ